MAIFFTKILAKLLFPINCFGRNATISFNVYRRVKQDKRRVKLEFGGPLSYCLFDLVVYIGLLCDKLPISILTTSTEFILGTSRCAPPPPCKEGVFFSFKIQEVVEAVKLTDL